MGSVLKWVNYLGASAFEVFVVGRKGLNCFTIHVRT